MHKKCLKTLDPYRSNNLPRLSDEELSQTVNNVTAKHLNNEEDNEAHRQYIKELLLKSKEVKDVKSNNESNNLIRQLEHKLRDDKSDRRAKESSLFTLDRSPLDTFALPGKQLNVSALAGPELQRKKLVKTKRIKVETIPPSEETNRPTSSKKPETIPIDIPVSVQQNSAPATSLLTEEFTFLPGVMGNSRIRYDYFEDDFEASQSQEHVPVTKQAVEVVKQENKDEVDVIMAGIKTGDDAINFFARYGYETPVKFVHLIQENDEKIYRPYDLISAEIKDTTSEYFTMTPAGIVHICKGSPSECVPLSTWTKQGMHFNILRAIPFYKYFLHRRTFTIWRENVRFQQYTKQRRKVSDRLFFTRPSSIEPILSIKRQLLEVQNVHILHLELKTCDKDAFVTMQTAQCSKASILFEESMRQCINDVQNVISSVNKLHGYSTQNSINNASNFNDSAGPEKGKILFRNFINYLLILLFY
jgi:hypothetical protein